MYFKDITCAREADLDVFKQEHMLASYRFKMILETIGHNIVLFARSTEERDVWLEGFCRVIDFNITKIPFDIREPS